LQSTSCTVVELSEVDFVGGREKKKNRLTTRT
jgi:hypothetical protein